jgi:16S rRNA (cytosine1402-N4)-methyltransferase
VIHNDEYHIPVLLEESIQGLAVQPGGVYVDCTLGGGGHFAAIIAALGEAGTAIGIDNDPESIAIVKRQTIATNVNVIIEHNRFSALDSVLRRHGLTCVDGILIDLGVSSHQIDSTTRGFSYVSDAPLDMRMDQGNGMTAAQLLATTSEEELARILSDYGEVHNASRMSRALKSCMRSRRLLTSADLKTCLAAEYGPNLENKVLAKIFQALRIAVNHELDELAGCLDKSVDALRKGGRLAVISYHSLEDRLVKNFIRRQEHGCTCPKSVPRCICGSVSKFKRITKKAVRPSEEEIARNRRSRSARLRIAEKTG